MGTNTKTAHTNLEALTSDKAKLDVGLLGIWAKCHEKFNGYEDVLAVVHQTHIELAKVASNPALPVNKDDFEHFENLRKNVLKLNEELTDPIKKLMVCCTNQQKQLKEKKQQEMFKKAYAAISNLSRMIVGDDAILSTPIKIVPRALPKPDPTPNHGKIPEMVKDKPKPDAKNTTQPKNDYDNVKKVNEKVSNYDNSKKVNDIVNEKNTPPKQGVGTATKKK
jgi:hypothetical protein